MIIVSFRYVLTLLKVDRCLTTTLHYTMWNCLYNKKSPCFIDDTNSGYINWTKSVNQFIFNNVYSDVPTTHPRRSLRWDTQMRRAGSSMKDSNEPREQSLWQTGFTISRSQQPNNTSHVAIQHCSVSRARKKEDISTKISSKVVNQKASGEPK